MFAGMRSGVTPSLGSSLTEAGGVASRPPGCWSWVPSVWPCGVMRWGHQCGGWHVDNNVTIWAYIRRPGQSGGGIRGRGPWGVLQADAEEAEEPEGGEGEAHHHGHGHQGHRHWWGSSIYIVNFTSIQHTDPWLFHKRSLKWDWVWLNSLYLISKV